jgi:hypothetical protein
MPDVATTARPAAPMSPGLRTDRGAPSHGVPSPMTSVGSDCRKQRRALPLDATLARAVRERQRIHRPMIQRHVGQPIASALLTAMQSGKQIPGYARRLAAGPALPKTLEDIKQAIADQKTVAVRDIVLAALRPDMALRGAFSFQNPVPDKQAAEKRIRSFGSGEGEYAFDVPGGLHGFFAQLYDTIAKHQPGTEVSMLDLFHGHVVPSEDHRDLIVLFHAKEWPSELTENQWTGADRTETWKSEGLLQTIPKRFSTAGAEMDVRNFLWTLSMNEIWVLSDPKRKDPSQADAGFLDLIAPGGDKGRLYSEAETVPVGTVTESSFGIDLMNVMYFPQVLSGGPDEQLFFTPLGKWGTLMYLESQFPAVDPKQLAELFELTGESREDTKKLAPSLATGTTPIHAVLGYKAAGVFKRVKQLVDKGISEEKAIVAFAAANHDVKEAAKRLGITIS